MPGKPDIILTKYRSVIFVHGCFWHGCTKCKKGLLKPNSNKKTWIEKIKKNMARDIRVKKELKKQGWKTFTIWECQISSSKSLIKFRKNLL